MDSVLNEYGDCITSYQGGGILSLPSHAGYSCSFSAGQVANGNIILICYLDQLLHPNQDFAGFHFEGTTEIGAHIYSVSATAVIETNLLMSIRKSGYQSVVALACREFYVRNLAGTLPDILRFGLTNFELQPGPEASFSLTSEKGATRITVQRVASDDKILRLQTIKDIAITCEARISFRPGDEITDYDSLMSDLCYVLSVARGTKVQWVYREERTENDELLARLHSNRVTKPFSPCPVIDPRRPASQELEPFVEVGYSRFVELRHKHVRFPYAVDAYLDGKGESDFLELRGLKIAITFEMLRHSLLGKRAPDDWVIEPHRFNVLLGKICALLKSEGLSRDQIRALTSKSKLTNVNRIQQETAFEVDLRELSRLASLESNEQELQDIKRSRNELVHEGRFYVNAGDSSNVLLDSDAAQQEFFFLVGFADRFFLRMLDYNGVFLDWSVRPPQRRAFNSRPNTSG